MFNQPWFHHVIYQLSALHVMGCRILGLTPYPEPQPSRPETLLNGWHLGGAVYNQGWQGDHSGSQQWLGHAARRSDNSMDKQLRG